MAQLPVVGQIQGAENIE
jgi:dihydroceramide fatty acyl 2-hydroxylase